MTCTKSPEIKSSTADLQRAWMNTSPSIWIFRGLKARLAPAVKHLRRDLGEKIREVAALKRKLCRVADSSRRNSSRAATEDLGREFRQGDPSPAAQTAQKRVGLLLADTLFRL